MITTRKPVHPRERDRVALRCFTAVDCFERGCARKPEWYDVADAVNIVEALCDAGKLSGTHMEFVARAIEGMAEAMDHPEGSMRLDGPQLEALWRVVVAYDHALERFSGGTIAQAQTAVVMKIARHRESSNGITMIEP